MTITAVTVVGAGVAGLVCAVELASCGIGVEIIERSTSSGPEACSWFAGGMLAPYCEGESAEPQVVEKGLAGINWWKAHCENIQCRGTLVVCPPRNQAELDRFTKRTQGHVQLAGEQIGELEKDLGDGFNRALFFAQEAHLLPRQILSDLRQLLRQMQVPIRYGIKLEDVADCLDTVVDCIVDCRGLAARDQISDLRGVRGEMLLLRSREITLSRPVRLLHPRFPVYIVPHGDGLFMVGATMIESDNDGPITARSVVELLSAAMAVHPAFGEAEILETGVGVRPALATTHLACARMETPFTLTGFIAMAFYLPRHWLSKLLT